VFGQKNHLQGVRLIQLQIRQIRQDDPAQDLAQLLLIELKYLLNQIGVRGTYSINRQYAKIPELKTCFNII